MDGGFLGDFFGDLGALFWDFVPFGDFAVFVDFAGFGDFTGLGRPFFPAPLSRSHACGTSNTIRICTCNATYSVF